MVCGVFQQIKNIQHPPFLYENSDFPTFYPETFSSCVCHQGAYRFGSPVLMILAENTQRFQTDVNISAFIYRQFHEDVSSIVGTNTVALMYLYLHHYICICITLFVPMIEAKSLLNSL